MANSRKIAKAIILIEWHPPQAALRRRCPAGGLGVDVGTAHTKRGKGRRCPVPATKHKTGGAGLGPGKVQRGEGTLRGWQGRRQDTQLKFPLGGRWFGASAKREESFLTSAGKKDILRKNFGRKPTGKRECFRKLRETDVLKTAPNAKTSRRRAAPQQGSGAPFVFACGGSRRGKISLRGEKRRQCGKSKQLQPSTTAK